MPVVGVIRDTRCLEKPSGPSQRSQIIKVPILFSFKSSVTVFPLV